MAIADRNRGNAGVSYGQKVMAKIVILATFKGRNVAAATEVTKG